MRVLFQTDTRLEIAIWVGDRLVGLGHCQLKDDDAVLIQAIEGDRSEGCPLSGSRALIVIETANFYAQALGKKRLLLQPSGDLAAFYVSEHDFVDDRNTTHSNYLWRKVPQ